MCGMLCVAWHVLGRQNFLDWIFCLRTSDPYFCWIISAIDWLVGLFFAVRTLRTGSLSDILVLFTVYLRSLAIRGLTVGCGTTL